MLDVVKDLLILMISSSLVSNVVLSQFFGTVSVSWRVKEG